MIGWNDPDNQSTFDEPQLAAFDERAQRMQPTPVRLHYDGRNYARETPSLRKRAKWLAGPLYGTCAEAVRKKRPRATPAARGFY